MEALLILMLLIIGFILGVYGASVFYRLKAVGALRVDLTDPDSGPYLFLELEKPVGVIESKKYVTLKIRIREDLSQK